MLRLAVFDPNGPSTLQTSSPAWSRLTFRTVNSTQLVSGEQKAAENCSEEDVTLVLLLRDTVRTSRSFTCQVMTSHGPATVALKPTADPLRTAALAGSSVSPCDRTGDKGSTWGTVSTNHTHTG